MIAIDNTFVHKYVYTSSIGLKSLVNLNKNQKSLIKTEKEENFKNKS